jgi:hypothetical protein
VSSSCTDKSTPPDPKDLTWNGAYDWRYSGKRPQESEHGKLWPVIAAHIEAKVEKADGKKVVIYAHSGGTITAYAFLMSQTPAWRKANVLAFMPVVPVFGGTLISLQSILTGWDSYGNHPHSFSSISLRLTVYTCTLVVDVAALGVGEHSEEVQVFKYFGCLSDQCWQRSNCR